MSLSQHSVALTSGAVLASGLLNLLLPFCSAVTNCLHSRCGLGTSLDMLHNFACSDWPSCCAFWDSLLLTLATAIQTEFCFFILFLWLNYWDLWIMAVLNGFHPWLLQLIFSHRTISRCNRSGCERVVKISLVSGFCCEVENCASPGYCAESSGNLLPMFRDSLLVPSLQFRNPKLDSRTLRMGLIGCTERLDSWTLRMWPIGRTRMLVGNYRYWPHNDREEHTSWVLDKGIFVSGACFSSELKTYMLWGCRSVRLTLSDTQSAGYWGCLWLPVKHVIRVSVPAEWITYLFGGK
jgi:hypothetical protein